MERRLTDKERVEYIRKGNELFNNGKFKEAEALFMLANYKDGILRIANRYYYELKKPLIALKFYYKIGAKEKIEEIRERMLFAFKKLIGPNFNQTQKGSTKTIASSHKGESLKENKKNVNKKLENSSKNISTNNSSEKEKIQEIYPDEIL